MKIKKTLFSKSIEIYPHEIREFMNEHPYFYKGLFCWIKKTFKLDLLKK